MSDNIDSPELFGQTHFSPLTSADSDSDSDSQNVALADTTVAAEIQRLASQVARDVESCSELKRRRLKYAHLESTFEHSIVIARQRINSLVEQQHRADFPDDQFDQLPAQPSDEPPQPAQPFDEPQQPLAQPSDEQQQQQQRSQRLAQPSAQPSDEPQQPLAQPSDEPHQPAQPSDEPQQQPAQPSDEQRQRPAQPSDEPQQQPAQPSDEQRQRPAQPSDEQRQRPAQPSDEQRQRPAQPSDEQRQRPAQPSDEQQQQQQRAQRSAQPSEQPSDEHQPAQPSVTQQQQQPAQPSGGPHQRAQPSDEPQQQPLVQPSDEQQRAQSSNEPQQQRTESSAQQHLTTESGEQLSGRSLEDVTELRSSHSTFRITDFSTRRYEKLGYVPRHVLAHQFDGMDIQTVVAYGKNRLQIWDYINKNVVGEFLADSEKLTIEQAKPVSSSVLALVSGFARAWQGDGYAGELRFMKPNWSANEGVFSRLSSQPWIPDGRSNTKLSVIEGMNSENPSDETRVSLFTGAYTGGDVYRRVFDISGTNVTLVRQQKMESSHSDLVSALCHVEAGNYVVSGSVSGDVYVNDHDVGTHTRKINLGENGKVSSITRCPFNTNVFMVGNCRFESEMSIYDIRDCSKNRRPALTLEDSDSTIKLRQNHPAWDSVTGLIFAPMRGRKDRRRGGFVNIWDPRFVKNKAALQVRISLTGWNTHSVDLVKTVAGRDRVMVTATDDHIGFTTFSCKKINI